VRLAEQLGNHLGLERRVLLHNAHPKIYLYPTVEDAVDEGPELVAGRADSTDVMMFDFDMLPNPIDPIEPVNLAAPVDITEPIYLIDLLGPVEPFAQSLTNVIDWLKEHKGPSQCEGRVPSEDAASTSAECGSPKSSRSGESATGEGATTESPEKVPAWVILDDLNLDKQDMTCGRKRRRCEVEEEGELEK
jgi:hypothetical protein